MSSKNWTDIAMEQLEGGVSQVQQQAKKAPSDIANAVISQVTGKSSTDSGSNEVAQAKVKAQVQQQQQAASHQANEDMVKELYAPTGDKASGQSESQESHESKEKSTESQKAASKFIQEKIEEGMSPDEAQKLYSLRRQLHNEYYQKLINYKKGQPEERVAEKVEKEKEEDDRMNLEEQKKKDTPIAVQMGANRTEKFPGASG